MVHGDQARDAVVLASAALFGRGELAAVDEATLHAALAEAGLTEITGFRPSWSCSGRRVWPRRCPKRGVPLPKAGANINNVRITDPEHTPDKADLLHGKYLVLRRGKRAVAGVRVVG